MQSVKLFVALILLVFWITLPVSGECARLFSRPEGPEGSTTCSDKIDNDLDGVLDENDTGCVVRSSDFSVVSNGYAAEVEAGVRTMSTISVTDTTARGGSAITLCSGKLFGAGQVALCGTFSPGTYYVFFRGKAVSTSGTIVWWHTSPLLRPLPQAYSTHIVFSSSGYTWVGPIGRHYNMLTGTHAVSQATLFLSGSSCVYITFGDSNALVDTLFLSTSASATPP